MFLHWDRYPPSVNHWKVKAAWIWKSTYNLWSTTEQQYSRLLLNISRKEIPTEFLSKIFLCITVFMIISFQYHVSRNILCCKSQPLTSPYLPPRDKLPPRKTNNHSPFYRSLTHVAKLICILLQSPLFQTRLAHICPFFFSEASFLKALLYSCFFLLHLHLSCPVLEEFASPGPLAPSREESSLSVFW